ncbi:MAG: triose-phosphate isomerase, partial [Candidatus Eremiobacteraeota bacterium]|nr:triose-phosphate isomerase [Candidatus Eremiobacteraeota bacterium]
MHKGPAQTVDYMRAFVPLAEPLVASADIALLPPFIDLVTLRDQLAGTTIGFGGQDCFWESEGAYTGEISATMLKDLGAAYCVVGHSERRRYFGENDAQVARKVEALIEAGLTPIVCVGESLEENQSGRTRERVTTQI